MAVPQQFRAIVGGAAGAGGAVGVPGAFAFGADVPVLVGIWVGGAVMIADKAGQAASKQQLKALATASLSGAAAFIAGSKLAAKLFHLVPGPGTLAAIGVNSSLDAFFTYRFLRSVAKIYDTYDSEEMVWQAFSHGVSLVSVWTTVPDFQDMMECIPEGRHLVSQFRTA